MRHCFSITTPGRRSIVPFRPSPFSVHSYQSLAHRKYHLPLRPLLLQRLFQLQLLPLPLFCLRRLFLPLLSYQLLPFQQPLFCCFLSAAASLLPLSYQLQPFQQPLSSQLLLWLFSSFSCRFLSCFSCSCFCRFRFLLQCRSGCPRLFCASAAALAASASAFSLRLQPLSSLLLPQL